MFDVNVIMMDELVICLLVMVSVENFIMLIINILLGNGNFYMCIDMVNYQSDQFNVIGQVIGDFKIFVMDIGVSLAVGDSFILVIMGGGDAVFMLGNVGGVVDIGMYEYILLDNGNYSWSLVENCV